MKLARPYAARRTRLSLVALIDVLFILLVYFMVTSVYRDLDMIPVVEGASAPASGHAGGEKQPTLLVRLDAQGQVLLRGSVLTPDRLAAALEATPNARVLILPSGGAPVQALAHLLDLLNASGVRNMQLLQLEGA